MFAPQRGRPVRLRNIEKPAAESFVLNGIRFVRTPAGKQDCDRVRP